MTHRALLLPIMIVLCAAGCDAPRGSRPPPSDGGWAAGDAALPPRPDAGTCGPERCGTGADEDCDGRIDEDCLAPPPVCDPIAVSDEPHSRWNGLDVARTSGGFALAWAETAWPLDIQVRMLDPEGEPAGPAVRIGDGELSAFAPAIAWSGSSLLLAFNGAPRGEFIGDIHVVALDASGRPTSAPRAVSRGGDANAPSLAWTGAGYVLAWSQGRGETATTYAMVLDASGASIGSPSALGPPARSHAHGVRGPGIAILGTSAYVAWPAEGEVLVARLDSGPPSTIARIPTGGPMASLVSIAALGSELALAWSTGHAIAVQVLDPDGRPAADRLTFDEQLGAIRAAQSTLTVTGDAFGVAYVPSGSADGGLRYARMSPHGTIAGEVSTALPLAAVALPRLVFDGRSLYGAWQVGGSEGPSVVFMRLDCSEIGDLI